MARKKKLTVRARLHAVMNQLNDTFVERESAIKVMMLAHLSKHHYLLVGDPGTAKSALAKSFSAHITDGRYFKVQVGKFTPLEKIFGPFDVHAFKEGKYKQVTEGRLAACEFVFIDEYYKLSEAALNEMLCALNEREYDDQPIPLMTAGTATNWPELEQRSEMVKALHDRTLLRCVVEEVKDPEAEMRMLANAHKVKHYAPEQTVSLDELKAAIAEVEQVTMHDDIIRALVDVRRGLCYEQQSDGRVKTVLEISGRRITQLQSVLKANAWLSGRDHVTMDDFSVLEWGMWNDRKDIDAVTSYLRNVDATYIQEVIALIDEGQAHIDHFTNGRQDAITLDEAINKTAKKAKEVRALFARPVYTQTGRETIKRAFLEFRAGFEVLHKKAEEMLSAP